MVFGGYRRFCGECYCTIYSQRNHSNMPLPPANISCAHLGVQSNSLQWDSEKQSDSSFTPTSENYYHFRKYPPTADKVSTKANFMSQEWPL